MSIINEIFAKLASVENLDELIQNNTPENIHLEFKIKRDVESPSLNDGLDVNLSKVISGFANAEGGVFIIGIDAPQRGPISKEPIKQLTTLEIKVNEYISRATSFPVQGVQVKKIYNSEENNEGFLVVMIPQSDLAPHRSQKDYKYYQRIGESFYPMEHYQIADMFGRRQNPKLLPFAKMEADINNAGTVQIILGLKNDSKAIAKFPYLKFLDTEGFSVDQYGLSGNRHFGLSPFPSPTSYREYRGGMNDVIQCGTELPVTRLKRHFIIDPHQTLVEGFSHLTLKGIIAAENLPCVSWKIVLTHETIQHLISNKGTITILEGELK